MRRVAAALAMTAVIALAAAPAVAAPPQAVSIDMAGTFTGPNTVAGTFTSTGAIADSGTYTETFRLVGKTIHGVKTLTGSDGTLVIAITAVVDFPTPTTATFRAGHWRVVSGTGTFARVRGGGSPGAYGIADLAAGTIEVSHRGAVVVRSG